MNRIRKYNNKYQVLVNNNIAVNPSIEVSIGELFSSNIKNYTIKEYDNLQDAMNVAYNLPVINFTKIHSDCVDNYKSLTHLLNKILIDNNVLFKGKLLEPLEIKETLFNRILLKGRRFTFYYDYNDIISFDIINPYYTNLLHLANTLKNVKELRLLKMEETYTHIKLIGLTDNNVLYEIRLWTDILYNFMVWIKKNNYNIMDYIPELKQKLKEQKIIDVNNLSY